MEVTKTSFNWHLPRMLNDLSRCCCVALDMEFSGIAGRSSSGLNGNANGGTGNPTIQERYLEVKAAAETYQILQIGLTFVEEDVENGRYILRPYNLHLSPVLDPKLDIDRNWSYQSSAVDFLMSNGFRMEAPFTEGIVYISRDEEEIAKQRTRDREARMANISEIDADSLDEDAVAFLRRVRSEINESIASGEFKKDGYINISRVKEATADDKFSLNSYQKRLVHQLVRAEYPDLVSVGRRTFVQIIPHDEQRERGVLEGRLKALEDRIARQTGFRWIVEALIGGDLSKLDPWYFASVIDDPDGVSVNAVTDYSRKLQDTLKSQRPTLVGHNIFVDLVYLYRTFIGPLPDRVEVFQQKIHGLFPLIVDTKYMETYNCGSSKASSSLEEVNARLKMRMTPTIVTDSQHSRYANGTALHEAGYDSLITAQVFLRLSVEIHEEFLKNGPPFGITEGDSPQPWNSEIARKTGELIDVDDKGSLNSLIFLDTVLKSTAKTSATASSSPSESLPQQSPVDWTQPAEVARIRSIFAHATKFDLLTDQTEDEVVVPSSLVKYNPLHDPEEPLLDFPEELAIKEKVDSGELIPRFDDKFWGIYGNKLRVFGTAEEVLDLRGVRNGVSVC